MRKRFLSRRRWLLVPALVLALLPVVASAHPLGNFTVNRYSRLELEAAHVRVHYVLDMAEIPTFQELPRIDSDRDGEVSPAEGERYLAVKASELQNNLHLAVATTTLRLERQDEHLEFPIGQGGLKTLRLSAEFIATLPDTPGSWQASYRDDNYSERLGWHEIVVRPGTGASLLESSVPTQDLSQELRNYPQDLLQSPLTISSASFRFAPGEGNVAAGAAIPNPGLAAATGPAPDRFAALVTTQNLSPATLLLVLAVAFGLGAAHALAPGHGKTIVAAYLVGARGTTWHAIILGLTTTVTHTAGVFALGLVTLFVSRYILPEQLYPWLGVISGLMVCGIGLALMRGRIRLFRHRQPMHGHSHSHDHAHDHHHDHDHAHGHDHHHDHDHDHTHNHDHDHGHDHGFGYHTHAPIQNISMRSLLALGISGGLLPCPSALVVLLSAIALGRVGFGLLLIVAFSLGLASVLTAIGILLVHARRLFDHLPAGGWTLRALPIASAFVVIVAGAGITLQALAQTGLLR